MGSAQALDIVGSPVQTFAGAAERLARSSEGTVWSLVNHTRYAAERAFARDGSGAEVWLVIVKATFAIEANGTTALADEQVPVCLAPEYRGAPGQSSLRYETDAVLSKQATDVLLHGHAYAPSARRVAHVDVTLRLGPLTKTLRVFGRRFWEADGVGVALSAPEPFERVPITYELAFGGADPTANDREGAAGDRRNPVGTGFASSPRNLLGRLACAVEDPASLISSPGHRPQPAGFGPIARDWSPRVELAGTYDQAWEDGRRPLSPVDFDERFHQSAPEDQRVQPFLRGGESVQLLNLTAGGVLQFTLPRVHLGLDTRMAGRVRTDRPNLHTVIVEPDVPRVIMVWQAAIPCHDTLYTLLSTRVFEKELLPRG